MIDHVGFNVRSFSESRDFYVTALAPLGYSLIVCGGNWAMLGKDGRPLLWFGERHPAAGGLLHLAFTAAQRAEVDAFYEGALAGGGRGNGGPAIRAQYHASYYAAFVLDPDDNNVEAVCHVARW